eukprot:scaffold41981_cov48-Phaeocystis_antarctica.AAC.1
MLTVEVTWPAVHPLRQPPPLATCLALHAVGARPAGAVAASPLLVDLVRGGREPVLHRRQHLVRVKGEGEGWG